MRINYKIYLRVGKAISIELIYTPPFDGSISKSAIEIRLINEKNYKEVNKYNYNNKKKSLSLSNFVKIYDFKGYQKWCKYLKIMQFYCALRI